MKSRKHILFLTPGFPENEKDTSCIPAIQLFIKYLNTADKVDITVIAFQYPYHSATYLWNSIRVHSIGGKNKKGLRRLLNWKKVLKITKDIHINKSIDRVHSFWLSEAAFIGNRISKKLNVPHSCTLMGQDALKKNKYLRLIYPKPEIITLSKHHTSILFKNFGIQSNHTIPWGIENAEFESQIIRDIDILGVGSLIKLKAFDRFIFIVKEIQQQFPGIRAEIVGEGSEMKKLQQLVNNNNLRENIILRGHLEREVVLKKMSKSRCLLHLSMFESFGMVLHEAMGQGVKVFAANTGTANEIDEIVKVDTNLDAVEKIVEFLQGNQKVISQNPYSIEQTVKHYLENVFII